MLPVSISHTESYVSIVQHGVMPAWWLSDIGTALMQLAAFTAGIYCLSLDWVDNIVSIARQLGSTLPC